MALITKISPKEQRNILHEIRKRKANWIGHILRRNCLLKQDIEEKVKGEMEVTRTRGRRHRKLLDVLKDRIWYSLLKEEALDRTTWRNRFGGGFEFLSDRILSEWSSKDTGYLECTLSILQAPDINQIPKLWCTDWKFSLFSSVAKWKYQPFTLQ